MRKMNRRAMLGVGMGAGVAAMTPPLFAQTAYPDRAVKVIVPFPPGGGGDALTRAVAEGMATHMGQSMVVDNKPGADQVIGTQAMVQAPADGYTAMITGDTMLAHAAYERKLPYEPLTDTLPVGRIAYVPIVLVANVKTGVKTVAELIARAKANPGKMSIGHIGSGSIHFFCVKLLQQKAGLQFLEVPYKGSGPTTTAVAGGEIDLAFLSVGAAKSLADAGKVVILGTSGVQRAKGAPQVPTIAEAGVPGYGLDTGFYLYVRGGTPQPVIARLSKDLQATLANRSLRARLIAMGFEVSESTQAEAVAEHKKRYQVYRALIKDLDLKWAD